MWRTAPLILLALAGCTKPGDTRPEPPKVVEVVVTKYVPVPASLTADCEDEAPREQTYAEAKRLAIKRGEYLAECTARMQKIRALK